MKSTAKISLMFFVLAFAVSGESWAWVNGDFGTGTLTGWTTTTSVGPNPTCTPLVSIATPGPAINTQAGQMNAVYSGSSYSAQLFSGRGDVEQEDWARISQADTVPTDGTACLSFWFAGVFENAHVKSTDPAVIDSELVVKVIVGGATVATLTYNWENNALQIFSDGVTNAGTYSCPSDATTNYNWGYLPWTNYQINLSAYAGQSVTLQATIYNCTEGGHFGVGYLDNVTWAACTPPQATIQKGASPAYQGPGYTITFPGPGTPVIPFDNLGYAVTFTNTGTSAIDGVVLNDTLPAGLVFSSFVVDHSYSAPQTTHVGSDYIWYVGRVLPGQSVTFGLYGMVSGPKVGCGLTNTAHESDLMAENLISNAMFNPYANVTCVPAPPTNTATNTPTNTPTFTLTPTPIWTMTTTNTDTPTPTNTVTNTFTATDTPTVTDTPTMTDTFTVTNTPTETDTPTPMNTATNTFTATDTPTVTDTLTMTDTFTVTNTPTVTETPTLTYTATPTTTATNTFTATDTPTATNTATVTNTPTQTYTPTLTFTSTPTNTPSPYVGMGKKVSASTVHAGDVVTYSIGVTVSGKMLAGDVITDILPANMTFVSFGVSPIGTAASQPSPSQLQWILPSPLVPGVYTLTYQAQIANFAPANTPLTNFAQMNYQGAVSVLTSSVPVTVIGNYTIKVNIYNSAGEVIKTIGVQQFTQPVDNISFDKKILTALQGPGSTIKIVYKGLVIGTWDGTDNQNNPVTNGTYRIQIDSDSSSGVVTSVSQEAIVNRTLSNISANIYNGAGELVRTLYHLTGDATNAVMEGVVLSSFKLVPSVAGSKNIPGIYPSQVEIMIQSSGAPVTLMWNGTTNIGSYASPGIYNIEVHWNDGNGHSQVVERTVMVLPGYGTTGTVVAKPNVLGNKNGTTTIFDGTGVSGADNLKVFIYTIAGELLKVIQGTNGTALAGWDASGLASGLYVAAVEVRDANQGVLGRQRLKLVVLH